MAGLEASIKRQNSRLSAGEIKTVAGEDPDLVAVVEVLGIGIVAVQPAPIVIVFDIEDLEVAVRVGKVRNALCSHCLLIRKVRNLKAVYNLASKCLASRTKYLYFLD